MTEVKVDCYRYSSRFDDADRRCPFSWLCGGPNVIVQLVCAGEIHGSIQWYFAPSDSEGEFI